MFQVSWLPEFSIGLHDYRMLNAIFRGRKAVSEAIRPAYIHHINTTLPPSLLPSPPPLPLSPSSLPPLSPSQGVRNRASFPPDIVEAYKYTFSKPGALTAPINYIRAIFNSQELLFPAEKKTISIPTLIIWVRQSPPVELVFILQSL